MKLSEAMDYAWTAMKGSNKLGVNLVENGWYFAFDKSRSRFGACFFGHKVIKLSKALTLANDEDEVRDTILHEIAHAIAGKSHGHDEAWKVVATMLGARPRRCYSEKDVTSSYLWTATCSNCNKQYGKNRMPRNNKKFACGYCCKKFNGGRFSVDYQLHYRKAAA